MADTRRSGAIRRRASTPGPPSAARTAALWDIERRVMRPSAWRRAPARRLTLAACAAVSLAAGVARASPAATVAAHTWCDVRSPHLDVLTDGTRSVGTRVALRLEE